MTTKWLTGKVWSASSAGFIEHVSGFGGRSKRVHFFQIGSYLGSFESLENIGGWSLWLPDCAKYYETASAFPLSGMARLRLLNVSWR